MNKGFRFYLAALGVCLALLLTSATSMPIALGQSQQPTNCRDPLAKSPKVLFCDKYTNGYVLFKDSMSPPNEIYTSGGAMEVIVFDHYVVVARTNDSHLIIPRDRVVYFGSFEIQ